MAPSSSLPVRPRRSAQRSVLTPVTMLALLLMSAPVWAGPYAPAAGQAGSTAIFKDDARIKAWATGYENYVVGPGVDAGFQTPAKALGKALGDSFDIVTLGDNGKITLTFDHPISNGSGADFVVFENSFSDTFLELAFVEASVDGTNWKRFPNDSLTPAAVPSYGTVDPTNIDGLGGKYRQGYGTPFDLAAVGLNQAIYVRIVDIKGDGSVKDTTNHPIYDPHPTTGSAGFDLDAVGVINQDAACGAIGSGDPTGGLARLPILFALLLLMRIGARPPRAFALATRKVRGH